VLTYIFNFIICIFYNFSPPKIVAFVRYVEKYCTARQATYDNTILRMRIACWTPKATNTESKCVIICAVPLQQWLHECALMLRYTYIACIVKPRGKVPHDYKTDKIRLFCISVLPDVLGSRFEGKISIRINRKYFSTLTDL